MNVISSLLDHPTKENKKLAKLLMEGVFINSLIELTNDNLGKISSKHPKMFSASFILDLETINVCVNSGEFIFYSTKGKFKAYHEIILKKAEYDEKILKNYLEELLTEMLT